MTRPVVFLGPSLPRAEAEAVLDATYLPPVRQGDLLRALDSKPPAIAIIDGIFTHAPTVRHREILWAMAQGVPVFGAASMGALRAAELHGHGMIGHGLIYRWYRRYPMLPDDAVAVTHAPPELDSRPLSAALVDLRRTLAAARRGGAIDRSRFRDLVQSADALPFASRSIQNLELASAEAQAINGYQIKQKAQDAAGLLRRLADHAASDNWPISKVKFPAMVHAWLDDLAASGFDADVFVENG